MTSSICGTELRGLAATLLMEDAGIPKAARRAVRFRGYDATALLRDNAWRWDDEHKTWVPLQ